MLPLVANPGMKPCSEVEKKKKKKKSDSQKKMWGKGKQQSETLAGVYKEGSYTIEL